MLRSNLFFKTIINSHNLLTWSEFVRLLLNKEKTVGCYIFYGHFYLKFLNLIS